MSEELTVNIRMSNAVRFVVGPSSEPPISRMSTILQVKQAIANDSSSGDCPVERQRLIFKGRILSDDSKTLEDYGLVESDQTIHLVKGSAPVSDASSTSPLGINMPSTNTNYNTTTNNLNMAQTTSNSSSNNNNNNNSFLAMQQMMQSQMQNGQPALPDIMNNPELISSVMNSPMMQSLMSNPDFMRSMMENNPQMQQVLQSNPEVRHMLEDPEFMRRSMELMRDPSAMQNMMRNQDLALSQIENIPGGFSALRRMYEDVQEPLMDAFANTHNTPSTTSSSNPPNSNNIRSGAAGTAMPNPWASNSNTNTNNFSPQPGNTNNSLNNMGMGMPGGGASNPWSSMGANGMPNMNLEQTISMLENPMINQMMNQMMSDPTMMQNMMNSNPMLRQMRESNPQLASMLSNPETMRAMMNPDNLRAMMQMQNAMNQLGQIPGFPPMPNANAQQGFNPNTSTNSSTPNFDLSSFLNQFQSTTVSSPTQQLPPEQRYRMQLQSLNDMGFDDNEVNIRTLTETHGNVNRAIDILLTNPPPPPPTSSTSSSAANNSGGTSHNNSEENTEGNADKKND